LKAYDSAATNYAYHLLVAKRIFMIDRRIRLPFWLVLSFKVGVAVLDCCDCCPQTDMLSPMPPDPPSSCIAIIVLKFWIARRSSCLGIGADWHSKTNGRRRAQALMAAVPCDRPLATSVVARCY
jgi:hypothetical protein